MSEVTFYPVCSVDELPANERLFIELGEDRIVIFNLAGAFYAIADQCTHDQGPLGEGEVEDHEIICPRHGASFDIRTGEAIRLPAIQGVTSYPVRVVGENLEIGVIHDQNK